MKNFIKFLWQDLYNKKSILFVNIYNIISVTWIACIFIDIYKHPNEDCLGPVFGALLTCLLNVFVYFICHIIFCIQTKKNKIMKDNPVIKSVLYRVISILSVFIACFHYLVFVTLIIWYVVLVFFESQISYFANKYLVH